MQFPPRRAGSEQGTHDQVQRDRLIPGFNLGDARLAGAHALRKIDLGQAMPSSSFPYRGDKSQFQLDQRGLLFLGLGARATVGPGQPPRWPRWLRLRLPPGQRGP